jgi:hypothetical protein
MQTGAGIQESGVRSQESGVRSQESGVRSQESANIVLGTQLFSDIWKDVKPLGFLLYPDSSYPSAGFRLWDADQNRCR